MPSCSVHQVSIRRAPARRRLQPCHSPCASGFALTTKMPVVSRLLIRLRPWRSIASRLRSRVHSQGSMNDQEPSAFFRCTEPEPNPTSSFESEVQPPMPEEGDSPGRMDFRRPGGLYPRGQSSCWRMTCCVAADPCACRSRRRTTPPVHSEPAGRWSNASGFWNVLPSGALGGP